MPDSTPRRNWVARTSLLIASLAFVLGAALEPVVHSPAAADELAFRSSVGPAIPDGGDSGQHDDSWCAVCHAMGGLALPTLATTPAFREPIAEEFTAAATHPPITIRIASEHARAPPSC